MSDRLFKRALHEWLEEGSDRTPPAAVDAVLLAIKTTPQQRDLRILRRFTMMPAYLRYAAAVAIVAIVGVGVLAFNFRSSGPGSGSPTPSPTAAPAAPGIAAWATYTSEAYGFTLGYPEDWTLHAAASRRWQASDNVLDPDKMPYADTFVTPGEGDASIGLFVWEMPAGEGADVESVAGLKAWAATFCKDLGVSSCEEFTQGAVPMCLNAGGDSCRGALLVPTAGQQYAFFVNWGTAALTTNPDRVRVVVVAREDSFPSAARYGGSVALLKSILTTMDVRTP